MHKTLLYFLAIGLLAVPVFAQLSVPQNVEVIGGDEEALRAFIARWQGGYSPFIEEAVTITIGALPEGFEIDVPLDSLDIVGTVQRTGGFEDNVQIIATASELPAELLPTLSERLTDGEWRDVTEERNRIGRPTGFVQQDMQNALFCADGDEPAVMDVMAIEDGDGAQVQLFLRFTEDQYICTEGAMPGPPADDPYLLLPILSANEDIEMRSGGGGGGGGYPGERNAFTTATLISGLEVGDVMAVFTAQLDEQGWEMVVESVTDAVAFSSWTVEDGEGDPWTGTLIVATVPNQDDRFSAILQVAEVSEED